MDIYYFSPDILLVFAWASLFHFRKYLEPSSILPEAESGCCVGDMDTAQVAPIRSPSRLNDFQ